MIRILATGDWSLGQVCTAWAPSTLCVAPEAQALIEVAWAAASARLGEKLFDGPMCRLEGMRASAAELRLSLSRTSYRVFLGTNLTHAELGDRFGAATLANPVGLSTALETADGFLVMGRRNSSVAYYPERIHPFAGAMEPGDGAVPDLFAEVRRELWEELRLGGGDLAEMRCIGIIEDASIRQPEVVFHVRTGLSLEALSRQLDRAEHRAMWSVSADGQRVADAIREPGAFTPVALGTILLWGRRRFGDGWAYSASKSDWFSGSLGGT